MKDLAAQTSQATNKVAEQISGIQISTDESVRALRTIKDHIRELETTASAIASAVDQQSVAGQDLARSIDIAARSTDEVVANICEVRDATRETGTAAAQMLTSANALQEQARSLRENADSFLASVRESSESAKLTSLPPDG